MAKCAHCGKEFEGSAEESTLCLECKAAGHEGPAVVCPVCHPKLGVWTPTRLAVTSIPTYVGTYKRIGK